MEISSNPEIPSEGEQKSENSSPQPQETPKETFVQSVQKNQEILTKIEQAEKRLDEKINQLENLKAQELLGGNSEGGTGSRLSPEEENKKKVEEESSAIVNRFKI